MPEATENQWQFQLDSPAEPAGCTYGPVALGDTNLFDQSIWEGIAKNSPEFEDNPEEAEHLAYRFVGQYLPALLRARTKDDSDHVWLAFWSYLIAPASRRKPFGLSQQAADRLITELQKALSEPT